MVLFTVEQFFGVFAAYNTAVWPAQIVLLVLALAVLRLADVPSARAPWLPAVLLGVLWLWGGGVYHLAFFTRVNPAARLFGGAFLLQGALLIRAGFSSRGLRFRSQRPSRHVLGWALAGYALLLYPILGLAFGEAYPAFPTFGAPCPTTIFTLALLVWGRDPVPLHLLVVPGLWAVVATAAATSLGVFQDLALPVAALLAVVVIVHDRGGRSVADRDRSHYQGPAAAPGR